MLVAACVQVARTCHTWHMPKGGMTRIEKATTTTITTTARRKKIKLQLTNANCRRSAFFQLVLHIRLHTEDSAGLRVRITPMSEPPRGNQGNPIPSHDIENSKRIETASTSASASQA